MQIKFVRSGGLAGIPGLNVEGTVDFADAGATVTSDSAKYRRDLAAPEAEQLRTAVDPAGIAKAKTALASRSSTINDAYHYDITIATKDGRAQKVALNAAGGQQLDKVLPGLGHLVDWIDQESQRIREHRLTTR